MDNNNIRVYEKRRRRMTVAMLFFVLLMCFVLSSCSSKEDENEGVKAYLIKIDGNEAGYVLTEAEANSLAALLEKESSDLISNTESEVIKVTLNSKIESIETVTDVKNINDISEISKRYRENGNKISFVVTVNEKQTAYISFETVYTNSSSHYEGTQVVQTKGEQGINELIYEVSYIDGEETDRRLVQSSTVKPVINEEILIGTKKSTASTGKYAWPTKSVYITSSYGSRYLNGSYNFHLGVDLRAASGTYIYAADGGKVIYTGYNGSYGYLIKIQHDNGDMTYYAHLSYIAVKSGTSVYKGQYIAKSGATGNVTGPHLHFEIRKNGSTVNPVSYLPSMKGVRMAYSESLDSCSVGTDIYLSHSVRPAFLSSIREREANRLRRHP